jgi:hypothetical protein
MGHRKAIPVTGDNSFPLIVGAGTGAGISAAI